MSQRSEVYTELRKAVRRLGNLKGKNSTISVIESLDDLWSHLIRTRAAIVKTLINRGDIEKPQDVDPRDFLSLYLQVHNPKRDSRLCEHCCGSVEFGISECPYCGEHVNGQNSQQFLSGITIDFDVQQQRPDWDIDTDPTEILKKGRPKDDDIDGLDFIRPITQRDDIIGPKGTAPSRKRRFYTLNRATRDLVAWVKKRELALRIPYTTEQLQKLSRSHLYLLVSLFRDKSELPWIKLMASTREELIRFVLGHQGTKPIDLRDPPHGELPELEDIFLDEEGDQNGQQEVR